MCGESTYFVSVSDPKIIRYWLRYTLFSVSGTWVVLPTQGEGQGGAKLLMLDCTTSFEAPWRNGRAQDSERRVWRINSRVRPFFFASLALFCRFRSYAQLHCVPATFLFVHSHMSGECSETHNTQYVYHRRGLWSFIALWVQTRKRQRNLKTRALVTAFHRPPSEKARLTRLYSLSRSFGSLMGRCTPSASRSSVLAAPRTYPTHNPFTTYSTILTRVHPKLLHDLFSCRIGGGRS